MFIVCGYVHEENEAWCTKYKGHLGAHGEWAERVNLTAESSLCRSHDRYRRSEQLRTPAEVEISFDDLIEDEVMP